MNITIGETHPWGDAEVAWRLGSPDARQRSYSKQIDAGNTHLIREVEAFNTPANETAAREIIAITIEEHVLLAKQGLRIPETNWHILCRPHEPTIRILAHVEIIEGGQLNDRNFKPETFTARKKYFETRYQQYVDACGNRPLRDIGWPQQYMYGRPRLSLDSAPFIDDAVFLVDIEPRIYTIKPSSAAMLPNISGSSATE